MKTKLADVLHIQSKNLYILSNIISLSRASEITEVDEPVNIVESLRFAWVVRWT